MESTKNTEKNNNHPDGCRCQGCVGYGCSHNGMCGWMGCGRSFSWLRLVVAILVGLFIFSAGMQLGEMRAVTYQEYGGHMMMRDRMYRGDMMDDYYDSMPTTSIVVPSTQPATTAPAATTPAR